LFGPDAVLENPRSLAAAAQTQAEPRHVVVEKDRIAFAMGQREFADHWLGEFHVGSKIGKVVGTLFKSFLEILWCD
jgi:hypothetical protein